MSATPPPSLRSAQQAAQGGLSLRLDAGSSRGCAKMVYPRSIGASVPAPLHRGRFPGILHLVLSSPQAVLEIRRRQPVETAFGRHHYGLSRLKFVGAWEDVSMQASDSLQQNFHGADVGNQKIGVVSSDCSSVCVPMTTTPFGFRLESKAKAVSMARSSSSRSSAANRP